MTHEGNFSISVKEDTEWDTSEAEHLVSLAGTIPYMVLFDTGPSLLINFSFDWSSCVVNAESKDLYFISPFASVLIKHLLIVSHWALAWWTPSGPEINQSHSAFLMRPGDS